MPEKGTAPHAEGLRLVTHVARLYHVHGVRQREIAERLGMSQARVSRLLQHAESQGIVRTVVVVPDGLHPELEEGLEEAYGLREAHVVEAYDEATIPQALGGAAARFLGGSALDGAVVGFTSWSSTQREMARQLDRIPRTGTRFVVEMLGDLGSPLLQHEAARATMQLARVLEAEPVFLRTPGVVATPALRAATLQDIHVRRALDLLDSVDVAFIGVGPADFHGPLEEGDNFFSAEQLETVRALGAAGQINQRFIDGDGRPIRTPLDELVVGVSLDQLRGARRRVVVAGGPSKWSSLGAALRGRWADVLVTDVGTAEHLLAEHTARVEVEAAADRVVGAGAGPTSVASAGQV
jgi:DNA-binding transcriptional regulator LsrR (DeoR family)